MALHVPRRGFLARLAAGASAFSATFALPRAADAQAALQTHELDRWLDDLKGRHKQVLDCVSKAHIGEMQYAANFMNASVNEYGLKDEDASVIISLRHEATPYAYNDAMWEKYKIGEVLDVPARGGGRGDAAADSASAPRATRNPQTAFLTSMAGRGVRVTACALATGRYAGIFARRAGAQAADVRTELAANLVPNCRLVPAGVVLINRAQEKGFTYLHVG